MKILLKLLASTLSVFIAAYIIPGVSVDTLITAVIVAIVIGALNLFIRPLIVFLTLPITFITLGLFYFVINAFIVYWAALLITGFSILNFWVAILFGIVLSLVNSFLYSLVD